MLVGEFREMVFEDLCGIDHFGGLLQCPYLQQETLPEVPCPDPGRIEFLYDLQHVLDFFLVGFDSRPECQVIHQAFNASAQIAVIVQTADNKSRYGMLVFCQIPESQLVHKALCETFLYGKRIVLRTLVLAVVVDSQLVARDGVVFLVVGQRHFPWPVFLFIPVIRRIFIKHGILFKLFPYPLLQFLSRQLDKLYRLDLERGELLRLFKFQSLFQHGIKTLDYHR